MVFMYIQGMIQGLDDKVNANSLKRTLAAATIALLFPLALVYKIILQLRGKR